MHLLAPEIEKYIEERTSAESDVLTKLNRETHLKVLLPQMLSGHVQGRFLSMMSHMIQPKRILEVGTYTGYAALCMAEGLVEGGKLHTIDINEELTPMVKRFIEEAGYADRVQTHLGSAIDVIPTLDETFDMVFIDADKINYSNYYDLVFDKVRPGGFIIADNVLWSGKVVDENPDKDTRALMDYSAKVHADDRVENVLAPVRDGLMIARKRA